MTRVARRIPSEAARCANESKVGQSRNVVFGVASTKTFWVEVFRFGYSSNFTLLPTPP